MPEEQLDIAIVGAGAAGLMAAICAGRQAAAPGSRQLRIAALDGAAKVGAKILVAGGGRCNVTHDVVRPTDFSGSNRNLIAKVLRSFAVPQTVAFFAELGVELKTEETGKLFPVSDDAHTVLAALLRAVAGAGAEIRGPCRVTGIKRHENRFVLQTQQGTITAVQLILATGGRSLPKTGSDGAGYEFARALGHTVSPTTPALVPLILPANHRLTDLSGLSVPVRLALRKASGAIVEQMEGPLLFTHFGLSGPVVLDISRHWIAARAQDAGACLTANLMGGASAEQIDAKLLAAAHQNPRDAIAPVIADWLPARLAATLCVLAEVAGDTILAQLSKPARRKVVTTLTALPLPVTADRGYNFAEVTAGGIPLDEVDTATMASRRCPGLYLCGEILDVDGRIGGYNFQWAWCSGRLAGLAAAKNATARTD